MNIHPNLCAVSLIHLLLYNIPLYQDVIEFGFPHFHCQQQYCYDCSYFCFLCKEFLQVCSKIQWKYVQNALYNSDTIEQRVQIRILEMEARMRMMCRKEGDQTGSVIKSKRCGESQQLGKEKRNRWTCWDQRPTGHVVWR